MVEVDIIRLEVVEWGVWIVLQAGRSVDTVSSVVKRGTIVPSVQKLRRREKTTRGFRIEAEQYPGGKTLNCEDMSVVPSGMFESEKVQRLQKWLLLLTCVS